jgi:hypothetical protein
MVRIVKTLKRIKEESLVKNSKSLLLCLLLFVAQAAQASETTAIEAATRSYVAANSGMTHVTVMVERVRGKFARAKVTPEEGATDPALVFLKNNHGKWTGLTLGTSFSPEDYERLGIPRSLRIE